MNQNEKVKFREIVSEAIMMYKKNYKALLTLSLAYVILSNVGTAFIHMRDIKYIEAFDSSYMLLVYMVMILAIVAIVYNIQVSAALILSVRDAYMYEMVRARVSYKKANGLKGKIFVANFLFGLMMIIPIILCSSAVAGYFSMQARIASFIVGFIAASIIIVLYGFAPLIVALEPKLDSHFIRSKNIVKGHYITVILVNLLAAISLISNWLISIFETAMQNSLLSQVIGFILENIVTILFTPFSISLLTITILKLTKDYIGEDKEAILLDQEA